MRSKNEGEIYFKAKDYFTGLLVMAVLLWSFLAVGVALAADLTVDEGTTYDLTSGSIAHDSEYVGYDDLGSFDAVFNHSGGTNTVNNNLFLGYNSGASGIYNLSGGDFSSTGWEFIGYSGTGVFNQSGGTHTGNNLHLGSYSGSSGTYNHSGGTNTVSILSLGFDPGSTGIYNLSGTGNLFSDHESIDNGVFRQSGGTHTVAELHIGDASGSSGRYELSSGDLSSNYEIIGLRGPGVFDQTGGTNTVINGLHLGLFAGSSGTYNLSGGELSANYVIIGTGGAGVFNQTGGTHTVGSGELALGFDDGSSGTYNLSGGVLSAVDVIVGDFSATGIFNQSGGTHNVTENLTIADEEFDPPAVPPLVVPSTSGTYNLSDGVLNVKSGTGTAEIINNDTFNYSGGELNVDTFSNNSGAAFNISGGGTRTVNGDVVNNVGGTVKTTGTTAVFTGTFTNNGVYISDPSNNYFVDLIVSSTGYLQGGVGDNWFIEGDFTNNSTQGALWNTSDAYLGFIGGGAHTLNLGGLAGGLDFAWGTLELLDGGSLELLGTELYVENLILGAGTVLDLGGATLYYTNLIEDGGSYLSGTLSYFDMGSPSNPVVTPEPSTYLLLGSGIAGLVVWRRKRKA